MEVIKGIAIMSALIIPIMTLWCYLGEILFEEKWLRMTFKQIFTRICIFTIPLIFISVIIVECGG